MQKFNLDSPQHSRALIDEYLNKILDLCQSLVAKSEIEEKVEEIKEILSAEPNKLPNVLEKTNTFEQQLHSPVHPAVKALETEFEKHSKAPRKHEHFEVSSIVSKIAKENNVSVSDLIKMFQAVHGNLTPNQYLRLAKDGSIAESLIKKMHILEMYETLKPGLGEKAWVAINKRLKAEGYNSELVDQAINHAILKFDSTK